jgi:hypothetical protein
MIKLFQLSDVFQRGKPNQRSMPICSGCLHLKDGCTIPCLQVLPLVRPMLVVSTNLLMPYNRNLCLTSTTLDTRWHSDFAKSFGTSLVQIEAQFGKVEAMFKDFCGFRIAYAERRLALGVEIVLTDPPAYFAHRKNAIGGMASFDIAKNTLTSIGLNCPIWLIGIGE